MPVTNAGYEHNCTLSMLQSGYRGPNSVCSGALMEHVYLVCYAKKKKRRNGEENRILSFQNKEYFDKAKFFSNL